MARLGSQGDNVQPQKASGAQGDRLPINRPVDLTRPDIARVRDEKLPVVRGRVQDTSSQRAEVQQSEIRQTDIVIPREVLELPVRKIEVQSPHLFRDFAVADVLDFPRLLGKFQDAVQSGTVEEIYRSLQTLQREPAAIARLQGMYQKESGQSLDHALSTRLQGSQLEYARQLIGRGSAESPYTIERVPQNEADYARVAQRLATALNGAQPDMEAVYATLTPLQRNAGLLNAVEMQYQRQFKTDIRDTIDQKVTGQTRDYALYLMGERNMETVTLTAFEAGRLTKALSELTFMTSDQRRVPVPFRHPENCDIRSYLMGQTLTEMGYAVQNVCVVSLRSHEYGWNMHGPGLRVKTDYAGDVLPGQLPEAAWRFHVAPSVKVETVTHTGEPVSRIDVIIDPSLADYPQSSPEWLGQMGQTAFIKLSPGEYKDLYDQQKGHPTDQTYVFSVSRNVTNIELFDFYDRAALLDENSVRLMHNAFNAYRMVNKSILTTYADLESSYITAGSLRVAMRQRVDESFKEKITTIVQDSSPENRQFLRVFPNLIREAIDRLPSSAAQLLRTQLDTRETG